MKALLIDVTRCTGCDRCVQACREAHELEPELPMPNLSGDGLSSRRLASILRLPEGRYVKKQCVHCLQPSCADACPVGAIRKSPDGPVIYDRDKCMGCRYCMLACPLDIPRYEWDKLVPYMQKCDMCRERLGGGEMPACVEACPNEACVCGDRDALLREARKRIGAAPDRYLHHVYGEKELGGTSVLYLSDVSLEACGWPEKVGERALRTYTWPLISKTPLVAGGVVALLTGVYWIIQRRMRLEAERAAGQSVETAETAEKDGDRT